MAATLTCELPAGKKSFAGIPEATFVVSFTLKYVWLIKLMNKTRKN